MKSVISIIIDSREVDSGVGSILEKQYELPVTYQLLLVGDYILNDRIIVERKTTYDFIESIIDGRLFRQAAKMCYSWFYKIILIEGEDLYSVERNIHRNAIKGALVSLSLCWRIPILFSKTTEDTAFILYLLAKQRLKNKKNFSASSGRKPKAFLKQQLSILHSLPDVGANTAYNLLNHFGSLEKVMMATETELQEVIGVGKVKSRKIRQILTSGLLEAKF